MARPKKSNKKDKKNISFTEYDEDVYDFLDKQKNASRLVKYLVRCYMNDEIPKKQFDTYEEEKKFFETHKEEKEIPKVSKDVDGNNSDVVKEVAIEKIESNNEVKQASIDAIRNMNLSL